MNHKQFISTLLVATFSAFLGGTFGVWFLMPPSVLAQDEPQGVIEAQEFRVVDANGRVRAQLSVSGNVTSLEFAHPTGDRPMLEILASWRSTGNSHLAFRDSKGEERATLGFSEEFELSDLSLYGPQTTAGTGTPAEVELSISKDLNRALSGRGAGVAPALTLQPAGNFSSINLGVPIDGPMLSIHDGKLRERVVLGSTRLRNTRTGSTEIRASSSLVLFDEEGKVVWSAP